MTHGVPATSSSGMPASGIPVSLSDGYGHVSEASDCVKMPLVVTFVPPADMKRHLISGVLKNPVPDSLTPWPCTICAGVTSSARPVQMPAAGKSMRISGSS